LEKALHFLEGVIGTDTFIVIAVNG
jgi:hypothetical protein